MNHYADLLALYREKCLLDSTAGVIGWDERTYMPPKGSEFRSDQMALLAKMSHQLLTSPRIGELLAAVQPATPDETINVREIRRVYDRAMKMPARLVEEIARVTTRAQNVWQDAKVKNDFPAFAPWLEKIVALKREEAQAVGYKESPYDALLDEYEPGATASAITRVFADLRKELVPLVAEIAESGKSPRNDLLTREFALDRQHWFGQSAAAAIGFDFAAGRLDVTSHPFCSGMGPGDCRLTTRYALREFNQGFFGILHEAGHGIYEQGLNPAAFGSPLGQSVSLGIHESQSRLWENQVGRGRPFWEHFFPRVQQAFPGVLEDVPLNDWLFALNKVERSFIRVEADEATYNLHIILRFELEQALLTGDLAPKDAAAVWKQKFAESFGITPPTDSQGCLQDIHWSMGGLGYFPTYTLGNLFAAQFMAAAREEMPTLDHDFRTGDFSRLKSWLNTNIHTHGQRHRPAVLCERITGKPLTHHALIAYLRSKYAEYYGIRP